ncbi:MAG: WxL protein peptidoglycan domain-containing protein [Candidatus Saccharibacteria bacterium]
MRRNIFASIGTVLASVAIVATSAIGASAATTATTKSTTTTGSGNALKVSPVRTDLTINPGSSQTIDVYVQNISNSQIDLHPVVNDFVAGTDESGTPNILLNENQSAPIRSFRKYVTPLSDFTVAANDIHDVKVTITIPKGADAGGYYGAVRFEPSSANSNKMLSLSASVGSLVLVTVPGNLTEKANIASLDVRHVDPKTHKELAGSFFTSGKELAGAVRINNTGNIQVEPFGKVLLKKSGKVLASYDINNTAPRGNVLPDSVRKFEFDISKNVGAFGKYTLEANLGYGTKGQLLTATDTFYVVPVPVMIIIAAVLVVVLFAIFVLPRMIKGYNARVVQKATGGKKK